jgi:hypothetical protein
VSPLRFLDWHKPIDVAPVRTWRINGLGPGAPLAAASMRYYDEVGAFSRLAAKSVVGNNQ